MAQRSRYLFIASMDVEPEREARFNSLAFCFETFAKKDS